jgi:hypothetical protein
MWRRVGPVRTDSEFGDCEFLQNVGSPKTDISEDGILQTKFVLVFDSRGFFGRRIRRQLFSTSVTFHLQLNRTISHSIVSLNFTSGQSWMHSVI